MEEHPVILLMGLSVAVLGSACVSALLIVLLKPLLIRYALARPNARSSHKIPTPQGGGIAVIGACFLMSIFFFSIEIPTPIQVLGLAVAGLALIGAVDDIRPLPAILRLLFQTSAVAAVILVNETRIFPEWIPVGFERAILILGGVWFVNLVNFMDGLDWITVSEMLPITAFIVLVPFFGFLPTDATIVAALLCGALLGFAPFNKPVARLFLGDVGSLPIGLLVGWMLLELAGTGALAAAILLPLYYLMDATITLLRRLARREKVWEAHRSHFYQKATDHGFSVLSVNAHVFGLNLVLAALAAMTLVWPQPGVQIAALGAGVIFAGLVLRRFSRPRATIVLEASR